MAGYYDSSLLLAAILGQFDESNYVGAWNDEAVRVASSLAKIECIIAVRRLAAHLSKRASAQWTKERLIATEEYLMSLTIKPVDADVEQIVRQNPRLASCRALDAIHLATAMYFQPHLREPLRICSLDVRLREVATNIGFDVRPTKMPATRKMSR